MWTNGVNSPYFHILGTLQYGVSGIFTCEGFTLLQALLSVKGQKDLEKKVPQGHPLSQKEVFYALISRIYAVILSVDMTVSRLSYLIETQKLFYTSEKDLIEEALAYTLVWYYKEHSICLYTRFLFLFALLSQTGPPKCSLPVCDEITMAFITCPHTFLQLLRVISYSARLPFNIKHIDLLAPIVWFLDHWIQLTPFFLCQMGNYSFPQLMHLYYSSIYPRLYCYLG